MTSDLDTLELDQAGALLKVSRSTLLRMARAGTVPAAKPARKWVFVRSDLMEFLRANYKKPCSTSEPSPHIGGVDFSSMVENSASRLVQSIEAKRRNSRPALVILSGGKQS
jgi:excisionase family DNA binding protein